MSGMELYERVSRDCPSLADRTVFMTGGTFTPMAAEFLSKHRGRVLEKPFELDELVSLLDVVAS